MRGDRTLRIAVIVGAVLLVLGALHLTSAIAAPVTFAVFIIALVWPLQSRLERWMPKVAAVDIEAPRVPVVIVVGVVIIVEAPRVAAVIVVVVVEPDVKVEIDDEVVTDRSRRRVRGGGSGAAGDDEQPNQHRCQAGKRTHATESLQRAER